jgi:hypothetical protein
MQATPFHAKIKIHEMPAGVHALCFVEASMKRMAAYLFVFIALVGFAYAPAAHAWGCKGHQTVAYLAELHLTPEAKQMVHQLLTENPIDPALKRWCGSGGLDEMADSATWADDYRDLDRTVNKSHPTSEWHYIDIPLGAAKDQMEQFCAPGGCLTKAITEQMAILKDKNASAPNRAMALRFILHFVGDLHQPLHASDNDDHGGNCVPLKYFRRNPHLRKGSYAPNLHHIWDTEMVESEMLGADPSEFAETLDAQFSSYFAAWQQGGIRVDAWAWESHEHAVDTAYGALPVKVAVEPAGVSVKSCTDDDNIEDRMLHKHIVVGSAYQDISQSVIEERLALGGIRLAMILNDVAKTTP